MPVLLAADDLWKAYGGKQLLAGANLAVEDRMKIGLVGRNGAGKSTLLRILLGEEEAEGGTVHRHRDLRIGNLPQHDPFTADETVDAFMERWSGAESWTCAATAARFGIGPERLSAPLGTLSGGWRTRVKLAAVLLTEPNLLVLDEPTNFLDLRTQVLLESFLADWSGALLVVSHDRGFLDATTTHTAELRKGALDLFPGTISKWISEADERREREARSEANRQAKAKQLQRFIDSNRANANTASQARSKAKQLARLEEDALAPEDLDDQAPAIRVPEVARRSGPALVLEGLAIGYEGNAVISAIDADVERGERLALVGDNGQGKTTLLRSLSGNLPTVSGTLRWTHGADVGIYAQHVYSTLGGERTVLDELSGRASADIKGQEILNVAGGFLFRGDDVHKELGVLSGGERARTCLAGLLLGKHTVLLLDEPTNHLDVQSVEALATALTSYGGTVIFASHDRRFCETVATGVIEAKDGRLNRYPGNWQDYLWRVQQESQGSENDTSGTNKASKPKAKSKGDARRRHDLGKQVASCERRMAKLTSQRDDFEARLYACTDAGEAEKIQAEAATVSDKLAEVEAEWLAASEELESLG